MGKVDSAHGAMAADAGHWSLVALEHLTDTCLTEGGVRHGWDTHISWTPLQLSKHVYIQSSEVGCTLSRTPKVNLQHSKGALFKRETINSAN